MRFSLKNVCIRVCKIAAHSVPLVDYNIYFVCDIIIFVIILLHRTKYYVVVYICAVSQMFLCLVQHILASSLPDVRKRGCALDISFIKNKIKN